MNNRKLSAVNQKRKRKPIPESRVCTQCKEEKPKEEFTEDYYGRPMAWCKACKRKIVNRKNRDEMEKRMTDMGGKCARCGESDYEVLSIRADLLMCANCHWREGRRYGRTPMEKIQKARED